MSVCALRGLECLSFVLVEMLDSLRCLPERQRRFRRSSRVDAFRRDRRLPASVFGPVLLSALPRLASIC